MAILSKADARPSSASVLVQRLYGHRLNHDGMAKRQSSPQTPPGGGESRSGDETEGRRFKSCRAYFRERTGTKGEARSTTEDRMPAASSSLYLVLRPSSFSLPGPAARFPDRHEPVPIVAQRPRP